MTPMEQPERPRQEGNVHISKTQLRARVQMMIAWEARREAREEVKRKLKAQGVKVSLMARAEITRLANAHLRAHAAELLAQAEASGVVQNLRVAHERRANIALCLVARTVIFKSGFVKVLILRQPEIRIRSGRGGQKK
jgi:hypothetical protein